MIWGIPNNNDLANHYHFALPLFDAIQQGHLHPGWFDSPNFGYGDAVVRFYPPALYYLLAAGRALTGNWFHGTLVTLAVISALGSLGAYFWARSFVPPHIAIWAAVFYAFMPYHLAEVYQASQLAEFAAGPALLFALAFTKRLCDQGRLRDLTGLAVAYAMLLLTHLPLAVFGSLALLVYGCLSLPRDHKARTILKLATAVGLGLAASAFYWTSMVTEMHWIIADGANPDPLLDYRKNFVFSSFSPEQHETLWWMGLLAFATIAMLLPTIVVFTRKFAAPHLRNLRPVALLAVFSLVMCTWVSKPLWVAIPFLRMAQHPFRWLGVASAIAPVVMAGCLPFWVEKFRGRTRPIALAMAGLVIVAMSFSISQTVRGATYLSRPAFEQILVSLKEAPGIIQWLPIWASAAAHGKPSYEKVVPPTGAQIEAGNRSAQTRNWGPLNRSFEVGSGSSMDARVATFYYPHWVAFANGKSLATRPGADGALMILLPPEAATIDLEFHEPTRAKVSVVVSIISWTLLAVLLIFGSFATTRRQYDPTDSRSAPAK
jgi:hypothetical protein